MSRILPKCTPFQQGNRYLMCILQSLLHRFLQHSKAHLLIQQFASCTAHPTGRPCHLNSHRLLLEHPSCNKLPENYCTHALFLDRKHHLLLCRPPCLARRIIRQARNQLKDSDYKSSPHLDYSYSFHFCKFLRLDNRYYLCSSSRCPLHVGAVCLR